MFIIIVLGIVVGGIILAVLKSWAVDSYRRDMDKLVSVFRPGSDFKE